MLCKGVYRKECVVHIVGAMDTHLTPVSMLIVCIHFFQFLTDMQRFPRDRALPHLYVDDSAWYLAHPGKVAPWSSLWGGGEGGRGREEAMGIPAVHIPAVHIPNGHKGVTYLVTSINSIVPIPFKRLVHLPPPTTQKFIKTFIHYNLDH